MFLDVVLSDGRGVAGRGVLALAGSAQESAAAARRAASDHERAAGRHALEPRLLGKGRQGQCARDAGKFRSAPALRCLFEPAVCCGCVSELNTAGRIENESIDTMRRKKEHQTV